MTSKKGPTGEEKRTLGACEGLNGILGTHQKGTWGVPDYYLIQVRTTEDHYSSLVRWNKWDEETTVACGFGMEDLPRRETSYLKEPFHMAWAGLSKDERARLLSLSERTLGIAQAVQNNEIEFRMGSSESGKIRLDIYSGHKFEDLMLFLPTWKYVAPALRGDKYKVKSADRGKIVKNWERSWNESGMTGFGGDAHDTYHEEELEYFTPEIFAQDDHFLMRVDSPETARKGVEDFKKK